MNEKYELTWNYTNYPQYIECSFQDENDIVITNYPYFDPDVAFDATQGDYILNSNNEVVYKPWHLVITAYTAVDSYEISAADENVDFEISDGWMFALNIRQVTVSYYDEITKRTISATAMNYKVDAWQNSSSHIGMPCAGYMLEDFTTAELTANSPKRWVKVDQGSSAIHAYLTGSSSRTYSNQHWNKLRLVMVSKLRLAAKLITPTSLSYNGDIVTNTTFTVDGSYTINPYFSSDSYSFANSKSINVVILPNDANTTIAVDGLGKFGMWSVLDAGQTVTAHARIYSDSHNEINGESNGYFASNTNLNKNYLCYDMMSSVTFESCSVDSSSLTVGALTYQNCGSTTVMYTDRTSASSSSPARKFNWSTFSGPGSIASYTNTFETGVYQSEYELDYHPCLRLAINNIVDNKMYYLDIALNSYTFNNYTLEAHFVANDASELVITPQLCSSILNGGNIKITPCVADAYSLQSQWIN